MGLAGAFFIDLMLAACILGYGAELCGANLYVDGDDIKDMRTLSRLRNKTNNDRSDPAT